MKRRKFIQYTATLSGILPALNACRQKHDIKGSIIGASASIGHLLRDKNFSEPTEITQADVVIVGGGVSGLSAARWLKMGGVENISILDLEKKMGGNSASGRNEISAFPWGAHYIPIPNNDLREYLDFLEESRVVVGYKDGLPKYNDEHLCFDPQERLYINGKWQDGLIPQFGVPDNDRKQIALFLEQMDVFRKAKGKDGKDAFAIPVDNSSSDEAFTLLDKITMKQWLDQQKLDSKYLHWYVNYCTRDDFGTPHDVVSAWAGIHYFAARKGKGVNAQHQDLLTWPEGNSFLIKELSKNIQDKFINDALAVNVSTINEVVRVTYFDTAIQQLKAINCDHAIISTPQFVTSRLLVSEKDRGNLVKQKLSYSPWMVANIKVNKLIERSGVPQSWDNVLYDSSSLGYVHASHQLLQQNSFPDNITYYLPLTADSPAEARAAALKQPHQQWVQQIVNDLKVPHPNIEEAMQHVDIMVWGHAMARPLPGIIHGNSRRRLQQPVNNRIFFAHTDLAGISIFEEGFYQGIKAADQVLKKMKA